GRGLPGGGARPRPGTQRGDSRPGVRRARRPGGADRPIVHVRPQDVLVALGAGLVGATRQELETLASRFLGERAISVVADRALEERRWTTPELLGVEERLVAAALGRAGERAGLVAPEAVREALGAHPLLGEDQAGMV